MKIADAIWLSTALLHMENPQALDFSVQEIVEKALKEKLVEGYKPGLQVHASKHCVSNKSPNPGRYRMLVETTRGRRRLFRNGDPFHPHREGGRIQPDDGSVAGEYQGALTWYEKYYDRGQRSESVVPKQMTNLQELLRSLRGSCKGPTSLLEAREREHRIEKDRLSR
jgi:hypothetical protein